MKVSTTFWSDKINDFSLLFFVKNNTKEILYKTDLNNSWDTYLFFKKISKFIKSREVKENFATKSWEERDCYQFAVWYNDKICPIKWFDFVISEKVVLHHDIAFETTMIKRNEVDIPFGRFPRYYFNESKGKKPPKYREFNLKARAYKYMANQIKNSKTTI